MIVSPSKADEMLKQIMAWPYAEYHAKAVLNRTDERYYFRELESLTLEGQDILVSDGILRMIEEEAGIPQHKVYIKPEKPMPRFLCEPLEERIAQSISQKYALTKEALFNIELEAAVAIVPYGRVTSAEILFLRHPDEEGFAHIDTDKFVQLKNFFLIDKREPIRRFQPTPTRVTRGAEGNWDLPF